jgi:hypothetical protein
MDCDEISEKFIKNLIYKNKVVIFGNLNDDYTYKAINFFESNFKYYKQETNVFLDQVQINYPNLPNCLIKKTGSNRTPMIFLNGMFIGGWRNVENMQYRRDFDIFF